MSAALSVVGEDQRGRARTRRRLIRAAYFVFAQHGYGSTTVKMVCDAAGFTRGAFYSNFSSLEELFIEVWRYHVQWIMRAMAKVVDTYAVQGADYAKLIEQAVRAIPVNERWHRVNSDFVALCTRTPELQQTVRDAQQMLLANMLPTVMHVLELAGRRVTEPQALGYALLSVHEGTAAQIVIDPDSEILAANRIRLLTATLNMYSEPIDGAGR
ncbi:TetR/AcrR family transcriptional regulator [Tsukamurella sp. 8F]|uniref:TetR/AcrR family transcriptional regulator n=1 Tax=unclassified Tsukamurella TaxID=2633480 RepID=UPI0023B927C9|nr:MULTISPECIES: TetR/AcrR family transcriptional regulator [unclassified Tsukamurella]MDF0531914.1 TetR/AcrR family transcriptional regulator [Tsukamurella sp. 8J]MDF0586946.1 TetR/AcrR family transcriptional regulator [Tsukamurella sp. 8F]